MEQVHGIQVITFSNHLLSSWFAKPELTSFGQLQYEITYIDWILASSLGEERSFHTCTTIENAGAICWEGMNDDFLVMLWMKIADLVLLASLEVHSSLSKCTWKLPQISSYAPRRFDRQPFTRNKQQSFKFDDRVDQNSQFGIISTPSAPKNFHLMKEPTPRYRNRNSNNNSRNMTPPDILLDLSLIWVWKPCWASGKKNYCPLAAISDPLNTLIDYHQG